MNVKQLYLDEFEEARTEYNNKQTREDRKIKDYFKKVCESQNDIACEIIIELGDMDFLEDKDEEYRLKMIDELKEKSGLTEEMKNTDMLYWVGTMNAIKNQAEEIVCNKLIYV